MATATATAPIPRLSTGPRTDSGKQRSAANAITHGLSAASAPVLAHEDAAEYESLAETYLADFAPQTAHEHFLVKQMVQARWRLERAERLQFLYLEGRYNPDAESGDDALLARMTRRSIDVYAALERYIASASRAYYRAHRELLAGRKTSAITEAKAATASAKQAERFLFEVLNAPVQFPDFEQPPGPELQNELSSSPTVPATPQRAPSQPPSR